MTYWWTHRVADIADWFPGGLYGLVLAVLLLSVLLGLALQDRTIFRRKRKPVKTPDAVSTAVVDDESVPEVPADALFARAQRFMAAGDYRAAVREWLRVMVRDLIEKGAVTHSPGMTVTELASEGGLAVPVAASTLSQAASIFSEVWYADREADVTTGTQMRDLSTALRQALAEHDPVRAEGVDA